MTTTTTAKKPAKGIRLTSLSWAMLGSLFRSAMLAGNDKVASQAKRAIALKKEARTSRKQVRKARQLI